MVADFISWIVAPFWKNKNRIATIAIYKPALEDDSLFKKTNLLRRDFMRSWERIAIVIRGEIKNPDGLPKDLYESIDDITAVSYGYASKIQHVQGSYIKTEKNSPCKNFYSENNFTKKDKISYIVDLKRYKFKKINLINIIYKN